MPETLVALTRRLIDQARVDAQGSGPENAVASLRRLLMLTPMTAALWVDLATAYQAGQQPDNALESLKRGAITADASGSVQAHIGVHLSRLGHFADAATSFETAFRLRPADHHVGTMLAAAQSRSGNEREAFSTLNTVAGRARANGDDTALAKLSTFLLTNGGERQLARIVPEFARVIARPEQAGSALLSARKHGSLPLAALETFLDRRDVFETKAAYYPLARLFDELWNTDRKTAIRIIDAAAHKPRCRQSHHDLSAVKSLLLDLTHESPSSEYDDGVKALLEDGDVEKSIHAYARAISNGEAPPQKYSQVIESGYAAGHPLWHLCNPFFAAWLSASAESADVQSNWATDPAIAGAGDEDERTTYHNWRLDGPAVIPHVIDFVRKVGPSARYLDVGCGIGLWLRFLAEHAGVDVAGLHGTDLHENRTQAAARLLRDWLAGKGLEGSATGLEERVFPCDVLSDSTALKSRFPNGVDAVTLFVVTGCFEDRDLPTFLTGALSMRPKHVLHTTVADRWTLYRGRTDDERYFEALGYRLTSQVWAGDPISTKNATKILLPQQYWPNPRVDVFERVDD